MRSLGVALFLAIALLVVLCAAAVCVTAADGTPEAPVHSLIGLLQKTRDAVDGARAVWDGKALEAAKRFVAEPTGTMAQALQEENDRLRALAAEVTEAKEAAQSTTMDEIKKLLDTYDKYDELKQGLESLLVTLESGSATPPEGLEIVGERMVQADAAGEWGAARMRSVRALVD